MSMAFFSGGHSTYCTRPDSATLTSRVVHVHEVAHLRAVAVNLDGLVLDGETDEPGDESLTIVLDQLARPVDVRQPQRAGADAEHAVVDEMIVLACGLVDA